jgi:hypothetical protein
MIICSVSASFSKVVNHCNNAHTDISSTKHDTSTLDMRWDWVHLVLQPLPAPDDRWWWLWSNCWNEDWQGKPKYSEKTCPNATLSTTNSTWPDLVLNSGCCSGKPVTNSLTYCATSGYEVLTPLWKVRSSGLWHHSSILLLNMYLDTRESFLHLLLILNVQKGYRSFLETTLKLLPVAFK